MGRSAGDETIAHPGEITRDRWSSMIRYCWRTSAAAFRASCTYCSGVYLLFGGLTTVCARRPAADRDTNIKRAAARAVWGLSAMTAVLLMLAPLASAGTRGESPVAVRRPGRLGSGPDYPLTTFCGLLQEGIHASEFSTDLSGEGTSSSQAQSVRRRHAFSVVRSWPTTFGKWFPEVESARDAVQSDT